MNEIIVSKNAKILPRSHVYQFNFKYMAEEELFCEFIYGFESLNTFRYCRPGDNSGMIGTQEWESLFQENDFILSERVRALEDLGYRRAERFSFINSISDCSPTRVHSIFVEDDNSFITKALHMLIGGAKLQLRESEAILAAMAAQNSDDNKTWRALMNLRVMFVVLLLLSSPVGGFFVFLVPYFLLTRIHPPKSMLQFYADWQKTREIVSNPLSFIAHLYDHQN